MKKRIGTLALCVLALPSLIASASDKGAWPQGYENWKKTADKVIDDKTSRFDGIHNIYFDEKAWKAFQTDGPYPEGSRILVIDYAYKDEDRKPVKGKVIKSVYMVKDKKQQTTGGWLYVLFNPENKPLEIDPVKACFECHVTEAKSTRYVIARYEDINISRCPKCEVTPSTPWRKLPTASPAPAQGVQPAAQPNHPGLDR